MADITPIAQHFKERLSGYRVYRRGPLNADWVLLPDPLGGSSALSIERPPVQVDAPVRYSFADSPGYPGLYEYYVIAYALGSTGVSAMEGEEASNIAQATLVLEGVDVYPPVWQGTEGISAATANEDGTVTVEWAEAVDEEHPPAPASPPVTYSVYYSAETPLDFDSATRIEDAISPWTSPQLAEGQEYYFAVRAQDSADPPNEDQNTNELAATITGGIVDDEPPVWTETFDYHDISGYVEEARLGSIRRLEVGDGKLKIWRADAEDELSPPVHYDLYYVWTASRIRSTMENGHGKTRRLSAIFPRFTNWTGRTGTKSIWLFWLETAQPPANVSLPPKYWRDMSTAPTSLRKIVPIDMDLPLVNNYSKDEVLTVISDSAFDRQMHTLYVFYNYRLDPRVATDSLREVWAIELDLDTGEWRPVLVDSWNRDTEGVPEVSNSAMALDGTPWFVVTVDDIHSTKDTSYFYRRTGSGSYEVWDPPDRQGGWNGDFSFETSGLLRCGSELSESDGQFRLQLPLVG